MNSLLTHSFITKAVAREYLQKFWNTVLTAESRELHETFEYWLWDICCNDDSIMELRYAVHVMTQGMEFPESMEAEEFITEYKRINQETVSA